jgi:hypothetical protein
MTTGEEYIAGTDPMLAGSSLRLEVVTGESRFSTIEAGYEYNGLQRWYSLSAADALPSGVFHPVTGFADIPADGETIVIPWPQDGRDTEFYRLETGLR